MREIQVFDQNQEYGVKWRRLPHWVQAGTACFITFRLRDSMPEPVLRQWELDRQRILRQHGITDNENWKSASRSLPVDTRDRLLLDMIAAWDTRLDEAHGECVLRRPELSKIVSDSFLHFDDDRYVLTDFVVMPNHTHLLAAFPDDDTMLRQCESWKRFTATQINRALGRSGHLWQVDGFDHLVRTPDHFDYFRQYIADNPRRAGLHKGEYRTYSKPL